VLEARLPLDVEAEIGTLASGSPLLAGPILRLVGREGFGGGMAPKGSTTFCGCNMVKFGVEVEDLMAFKGLGWAIALNCVTGGPVVEGLLNASKFVCKPA
jgi:hypothetical protein